MRSGIALWWNSKKWKLLVEVSWARLATGLKGEKKETVEELRKAFGKVVIE